jgi:hypothetical protein
VDAEGRDVALPGLTPPGFEPAAEVAEGLVGQEMTMEGGVHTRLIVWDPVSGRTTRSFGSDVPTFLAAGRSVVAWNESNGAQAVHLTDTSTGADRVIAAPSGFVLAGSATLSSDASTLVMLAVTTAAPPELAMAAVDIASGSARLLSGWRHVARANEGFAWTGPGWSPDGATLFFANPAQLGGEGIVYAYRTSGTSIAVVPMTVGPFDASAVGAASA